MIAGYEVLLSRMCEQLDESHMAVAIELASLPDQIRGFGPVKEAAIENTRERRETLLDAWSELRKPSAGRV